MYYVWQVQTQNVFNLFYSFAIVQWGMLKAIHGMIKYELQARGVCVENSTTADINWRYFPHHLTLHLIEGGGKS
jgi:hypothetical protein